MSARELAAVPLGIIALFFLILVVGLPFMVVGQASEDAMRLQAFKAVENHIASQIDIVGELPSDAALRDWAGANGLEIPASLTTSPIACFDGFQKPADDRFVMGFWAGEWSECYSSPSGANTLLPSIRDQLAAGRATDSMIHLLLALGSGWLAWRLLYPRPGRTR